MSLVAERLQDNPSVVRKYTTSAGGAQRLSREVEVYRHLSGDPHVARLVSVTDDEMDIAWVEGESFADWIGLTSDWRATPPSDSKKLLERLGQYVEAEMSLLSRCVLYRDMNLRHVIFTDERAVIIDLEAAEIKAERDDHWYLQSPRGTWETMAPEEFKQHSLLSERTVSYRVAVLIHLVLTGRLPFVRGESSKSAARKTRLRRPLHIDGQLSKGVRRVLMSSLQIEPTRRHRNPERLFNALKEEL